MPIAEWDNFDALRSSVCRSVNVNVNVNVNVPVPVC